MFGRWERHGQGPGGWADPCQQHYASILSESCCKICLSPAYKRCLTSRLGLKLSFPWCAIFFFHFSGIFPKLFVLYILESRGLFCSLKMEQGNWSSLHWDKTKWNNKCFGISLEFTKCGPISCIFSPLSLELLVPHARWLSCTLDHVYPISLADLLSPLHILLDGILDPWAYI